MLLNRSFARILIANGTANLGFGSSGGMTGICRTRLDMVESSRIHLQQLDLLILFIHCCACTSHCLRGDADACVMSAFFY